MTSIIDFLKENGIAWFPISLDIEDSEKDDPFIQGLKKKEKKLKPINHKLYLHKGKTNKKGEKYDSYLPEYTDFKELSSDFIEARQDLYDADNHYGFNAIWIDTSKIAQIDLDCPVESITDKSIYEFIQGVLIDSNAYYKSITKPYGYHFFVSINDDIKDCIKNNAYKFKTEDNKKFEDIDFLCGQGAYALIDAVVENANSIETCDRELFDEFIYVEPTFSNTKTYENYKPQGCMLPTNKTHTNKNLPIERLNVGNESIEYNPNNISDEDMKLADIIDTKDIDDYKSWIKMMWACKYADKFDLAVYISKRSGKYQGLDDVLFNYNKFNPEKEKTISFGTFYYYAKKGDADKYRQIRSENNSIDISNTSDAGIATLFYQLYGDDHLLHDKVHYFYNGVYWEENRSGNKLKKQIKNEMMKFYSKQLLTITQEIQKHSNDEDKSTLLEKKRHLISTAIGYIQDANGIKDVAKMVDLEIEKGDDDFKWEQKPYYFAFKNKIYDLTNLKWVENPKRDDYVYITAGYDYEEPTQEQIDYLKGKIAEILPVEEERNLYLVLLATGLVGETLEKFVMANGSGGNGKGLLNELVGRTLGNYAYNCSNTVLLNPLKQGSNPEVANMEHKRVIFYREPDESQSRINIATFKELTGGGEINARKNFSNKTKTILTGTHILECNKRPKLAGRIDNAVARRMIDIPFRSSFVDDPEMFEGDYVFKKDGYFKTEEFKETYKFAMFNILLEYWKLYKQSKLNVDAFMCQSVKERTMDYMESNDEIKNWFNITYERTQEEVPDVIQIKDMYEDFKQSELWTNMSKKERREMSKKNFEEYICTGMFFRRFYKERLQDKQICDKYDVKQMRNVLVGFKKFTKPLSDEEIAQMM